MLTVILQFWKLFGALIAIFAAIYWYFQLKKERAIKSGVNKVFMLVKVSRTDSQADKDKDMASGNDFKQKIARFEQFLSAMHSTYRGDWTNWRDWNHLIFGQESFSLELAANYNDPSRGAQVSFHVVCPRNMVTLVQRQITAYYPNAYVEEIEDYNIFGDQAHTAAGLFSMDREEYFPIKTYDQYETDPMNGLIDSISVLALYEGISIQILLKPKDKKWSKKGQKMAKDMYQGKKKKGSGFSRFIKAVFWSSSDNANPIKGDEEQIRLTPAQEEMIKKMEEKSNKVAFDTTIRVVASATTQQNAKNLLSNIMASFRQYTMYDINGLDPFMTTNKSEILNYMFRFHAKKKHSIVLSSTELASMFHFPNSTFNSSPNIEWLKVKLAPAPSYMASDGLMLGHNVFRGVKRPVRISLVDRFRHLYIIGQTGMGKSVLQKTLIKQDLAAGHGICVVDPHGDLVDDCLEWVPKERAKDVILFNPNDTDRPLGLNLLEAKTAEERDFIALDAMNMMIGLYGNEVFGPRIQDYFRNGCLTLMEDMEEGGAITDMVRLFTDDAFQKYKLTKVTNPVVRSFWENQMAKTGEKEKAEMIPYFAAKFGAFTTNTTMRNIVGQTKSAFDFSEAMNTNKIVLAKLAKGLIGDINANLLGMIFVNKIQVAAMRRASLPKEQRTPFFLYVDEFQNFVTDAFESILSEARKYKLGLIIAHQYIAQLTKDNNDKVKNAVFGNVGTMINFKIGAQDAEYMAKEMAPSFTEQDLISLEGFQTTMKLNVNNIISTPFSMNTLKDFEDGDTKLAETITQIARLRWGRDVEFVNREILMRIGVTNADGSINKADPK